MVPYSLYLHIPFCRHRCAYCDFNTYAGLEELIPAYVDALCREAQLLSASAGARLPVHTIFFGGGTPSLLSPGEIGHILQVLAELFYLSEGIEITLEANPGTLSIKYLRDLRLVGVNRLSLGMQSSRPEELRLLERQHVYSDVVNGVNWSRQAGINNLNLDLIFGLPYQGLILWQENLEQAIQLRPEHLSLYALTLEHGTPMAHWVARGLLAEPDPDLAAEMYEWAAERLAQGGYEQYEISNWANQDGSGALLACQHNLQYWRNQPYLGLGAGAHGFASGLRTANVLSPAAYIQRCQGGWGLPVNSVPAFPVTPATVNTQAVDRAAEMGETMMMGLRLTQEGVSRETFLARFGHTLEEVFGREIEELIALGLLEWAGLRGEILRLTARGRLLGNQVFMRFI
jgi:oxygen-independent coproporphyrinogen-3 oxidase